MHFIINSCCNNSDGSDYDRGPHEIMIPLDTAIPSDGTHCATIGTMQDELVEGDHDFDVSISMISHEDVVRGSPSTNTITISDSGDGMLVRHGDGMCGNSTCTLL